MAKSLTIALMDGPYESGNTTTAFRIMASALKKGLDVNVFAYEGAVSLTIKDQQPHANAVKGTTLEQEGHPTTRAFVAGLLQLAKEKGVKLDWINCGLCVDERGAGNWIEGVRRGSPADFFEMVQESANTLVIPTK
jgi:tRNA 2-thiouridine synthesizing protein D